MDRRVFTALLLSVVVVGTVVLAFAVFQPFLLAVLWATVLAIVTYPAYETLKRLMGGHKTVAAGAMTVLVFLIIIGPFVTLSLHLIDDVGSLTADLQPKALAERLKGVTENTWVKDATGWIEDMSGRDIDLAGEVSRIFNNDVLPLLPDVSDVLKYLGALLAQISFIVFALFYFYRDGPAAARAVRDLVPLSEIDRNKLFKDLKGAMEAAVRGSLVTALAQGFLGFVILYLLDIERPVVWAAVMALASLVPLVGTALVWLPMAAFLALDGEVTKAVILTVYGVLVIGLADNFLRPLLVSRHMEAHPLLLFFGILGGIALFGFAGIVLGPVVVAFLNAGMGLFRREFGAGRVVIDAAAPATEPEPEPEPATTSS